MAAEGQKLMGHTSWGLLGPEILASERRTRTLGLGATVRVFNDLAVPGLGGVWFGKQLFLATLGVAVAEGVKSARKRAQNIEVANAIEALACWLALSNNGWQPDPRLRGATKMRNKDDLAFAAMRKPSFYVTQPMRQATVQPLRALGFVESIGERFNAFCCTQLGHEFIEGACDESTRDKSSVLARLIGWGYGDDRNVNTAKMRQTLSPLQPMPERGRNFVLEQLIKGTGEEAFRRRKALEWVQALRNKPRQRMTWDTKPKMLDDSHWRDLRAGALFFTARDAAISLLDTIETHIAPQKHQRVPLDSTFPKSVADKLRSLRESAQAFCNNDHDPSPGARAFCHECIEPSDARLLEKLLGREGRVLCLRDGAIVPGVAFRGTLDSRPATARSAEEDGAESEIEQVVPLPDGISHRVRNLFFLNLDLCGKLDDWLGTSPDNNGGA